MQFTYQARDATGRIREGEISALNNEAAMKQLRQDGLYLLSLVERTAADAAQGLEIFQRRIKRTDIIYLTNQLAIMVDAGVPVASALDGLAAQADGPRMKAMLSRLQQDVEGGEPFSVALSKYPRYFDKTYVNLVKASEASGTLARMLERIAIQARAEYDTRQQVQGALTYPLGMLVMCVGVCIFLLTYVFPKITPMFVSRGLDLPTPTVVIMAVSSSLTDYWYLHLAGLIIVIGFCLYARTQEWGRWAIDWIWLNVPILGAVVRKVTISRSLRTLATTVNAGVPMLESLQLTAAVSNNLFYDRAWTSVATQVTGGRQIHESLGDNTLFPNSLLQMIASGERTGKLGEVLNKVSDYYDREVTTSIKSATSVLEPIMVSVMGIIIGTIALAMLLPIFKLSSHMG